MQKKADEKVESHGEANESQSQPWSRDWREFDPSMVEGDRTLIEELTTYRDHLEELLKREGDYVLIKGNRIVGIFADRGEAIEKAVDLFGEEPVLVKRIVAKEPIHTLEGIAF